MQSPANLQLRSGWSRIYSGAGFVRSVGIGHAVAVPSVDVVDQTFLAVPPAVVAAEFAAPSRWAVLWPDLALEVVSDRGPAGLRWTVTGALVGSMEVWLEPVLDGTVVHYFLRADQPGPNGRPAVAAPRWVAAEAQARQRAAKAIAFALKDRLEAGRAPGEPPSPAG
jgi:hypothetical protein